MPENFLIKLIDHPMLFITVGTGVLVFFLVKTVMPQLKELNLGLNKKLDDQGAKLDRVINDVEALKTSDAKQREQIEDIQFNQQRKTIFDGRVPISDRVAAAIRYSRNGGNSETGKFIAEKLRPENKELFRTLEAVIGTKEDGNGY
jgi:hypothetical protein